MSDATTADLDGAKPVRDGEELDLAKLDEYLATALQDVSGELVVEQFPSGFSNLTYLLRKGETELVLRRPPLGARVKSGHDMGREVRVLRGLGQRYAVAPKPLAYCEDEAVLGAPFYVMERRRGVIVRRKLPASWAKDPATFKTMCNALVDTLADLHAVDVEAVGLGDLGRPKGYIERQVRGWIGRFEKSKTSELPDMDALGRWLVDNMPAQGEGTLVHNDYKFDNVMFAPDDPSKITAVLDWEMCTLGDPLIDLGTTLGYWVQHDDDPVWKAMGFSPTTSAGALTRQEVAARYGERTGRDVSNMLYYYCFALLKIGVIVQQIFYRYANGMTRDPRFAQLDRVVAALASMGVSAAERGRY